jgi:hypothetical protein
MKKSRGECSICGGAISDPDSGAMCVRCQLAVFQLETILDTYVTSRQPPDWIIDGLIEITSWIYKGSTRGAVFFNVASEVAEQFLIECDNRIPIDELEEANYSALPVNKILDVLRDAQIITYNSEYVMPSALIERLRNLKLEGYAMGSEAIKLKLKEMHGVIAASIAFTTLKEQHYRPQKALAILKLISQLIARSDPTGDIEGVLTEYDVDVAFNKLPIRQQNKTMRQMSGFDDGETKIIEDIDSDSNMPIKDCVIAYAENIRERFRERERTERYYTF